MSDARRPPGPLGSSAFVLGSLLFHVLWLLVFGLVPVAPRLHIEFELPSEVEFGLAGGEDGAESAPAPAPPPPPEPKPERKRRVEQPNDDVAEVGSRVVDAGLPAVDAGPATDAGVPPDGSVRGVASNMSGDGVVVGAQGDGLGVGAGGHGLGGYAPTGAQIALHVDVDRIRSSSLILETEALLDVIPQWQRLLKGSGISPLEDLERVFVASPNLKRSRLVVSARYRGDEARLRRAVARLAKRKGKPLVWRSQGGFQVAPWHSRGPTERVIALVGQGQFTITRPVDLPRVLAVAHGLSQRNARERGMEKSRGPAALLAMYEDEAVAVSVENVGEFIKGDHPAAPKSFRLSVRSLDEFHTELTAIGRYKTPESAERARDWLDEKRLLYVDHQRVAYLGLKSALEGARFEREDRHVAMVVTLTLHQTRYLMGYLSQVLQPRD